MERDEFYSALYLAHHGVKGQRWGIRRYQNEDGSLTPAGERRAQRDADNGNKWATTKWQPSSVKSSLLAGAYAAHPTKLGEKLLDKSNDKDNARWKAAHEKYMEKSVADRRASIEKGKDRAKTALKGGATVAVAALAAYGGYKLAKYRKGKALGNAMADNLRRADSALKEYGNIPLKKPSSIQPTFGSNGKQSVVSLAKDAINSKSDTKALSAKTKEILDSSREARSQAEKTIRSTEQFLNKDVDYNARIMETLRKMEEMGRTGKKSK